MKKLKKILIVCVLIATFIQVKAQGIEITSTASIQAVGNASIEITNGNFVNDGTYTMGTENLIFSGSVLGNILGLSNNDFYHLTVNNSNGVTHLSTGYVAVNNLLTFSLGLFNTGSNHLIINDNATHVGASTTKYINGNCRKVGNDAFVFPVGNLGKYAPISITAPDVVTDHFSATYFKTNPNPLYNVSLKDAAIDHVSTLEYWVLDRTNGSSNVNVSLYWDSASAINNLADLRVVRWSGDSWENNGNSSNTGNSALGNITSNVVNNFSPFTFGSVSVNNPLPVELISFTAECENGKAIINWVTASETNCDYFKIEKMTNGNSDFSLLTTLPGNGNTHQLSNYQIEDNEMNGVSYYRLSQVDFNGKVNVYNQTVIYSNCVATIEKSDITLYQNSGDIYIVSNSTSDVFSEIKIFDLNGKLLLNTNRLIGSGINKISTEELNLSSGLYLVNIQNADFNKSIKMIVR